MNGTIFEVVIVGAGPSGLMCSYYLKHLGLEHIIFDQGRLGESWRSQRWNSFRMITPFRSAMLPGALMKSRKPDAYGTAADMVALLQEYASSFQLPVAAQARVLSIEKKTGSPVFHVNVLHEDETVRVYDAWQVIVAVGASNRPFIPPIAASLATTIDQVHAADYRDAETMKPGAVVVVGGGQSGLEIAQDLLTQGRKVWLSSVPHPLLPRYYRGKEMFQWLQGGWLLHRLPDDMARFAPVISYALDEDSVLDRASLAARGVGMLGPLTSINNHQLVFAEWKNADVLRADEISSAILKLIDSFIDEQNSASPGKNEPDVPATGDTARTTSPDVPSSVSVPAYSNPSVIDVIPTVSAGPVPKGVTLDAEKEDITTIVWATGFTGSLPHLQLPQGIGQPGPGDRGATSVEGLYIVGAGSSANRDYVVNAKDEASYVTNRIYGALR